MKARNMVSVNGNAIANQFIIEMGTLTQFQSYDSPIVSIDSNKKLITVFKDYDYSKTTGKYRNLFMHSQGFSDMETIKGFNYYMNLGAIGDYEIVKAF